MKKNVYFLITLIAVFFTACSNDNSLGNFGDNDQQTDVEQRSAADKIFTLTPIDIEFSSNAYTGNRLAIDSIGNVYTFVKYNDPAVVVKKYDVNMNQTADYATVRFNSQDLYNMSYGAITIDKNEDLYISDGRELLKIYNNGNAIANLTSRVADALGDDRYITQMCGSYNNHVFIGWARGYWDAFDGGFLKLALNGKATVLDSWVGSMPCMGSYAKGAGLFKPKGSYLYSHQYYSSGDPECFRIEAKAGSTSQVFDLKGDSRAATASVYNSDIYVLRGHDIFKLRPNKATDLLVGTIPSSIKGVNGDYQSLSILNLWVNSDASVFYIHAYYYYAPLYSKDQIIKLTLD